MTTKETSMPYDWLKQIPTALLQLDDIPLFGYPPEFPWIELSKSLSETFEIQDFKIEHSPFQWCIKEDLTKNLGSNIIPTICSIPSLEGQITWVMAQEDSQRLMSLLMNDKHHELAILEEEFFSGFYYFTAYEIIHAITKLPFGKDLSPQLKEEAVIIEEDSLVSDIRITLRGVTLTGRLLISPSLRKSWKEKFAERTLEVPIQSSLTEKLTLPVHLEIGKTSLIPSLWDTVKPGDFVVLDSCSIQPDDENGGRVTLTVNGMPFFIGKLKKGNIKILDHPLYHLEEEITDMGKHIPNEDEDSSFDFDTEESDLHSDFDTETELDSEVESEFESEVENSEIEDDEFDSSVESELEEEENIAKDSSEESSIEGIETDLATETKPSFKIDEVPLSIVVEVGRLQMSIKKIMDLQPGNLLELDIHPENGVDLVVNGKRIAKAELVKIGEALGVRILDIS